MVGEVASAGEFLRSLSLLLFPLRRGSGMKVKVLEAIATGVPVVTTPAGAEGIRPNDGVVVAEDDVSLGLVAADILRDEDERRRRGEAARTTFLSHYTPKVATEPLAELYRRMSGAAA
jgi:glycosyltransferase involved in cell wall biosynthesis